MSLPYVVVARQNPQNRDLPPLLYMEARSRGSIDTEALLDSICEDNTLNRDEARMALNRAFKKIPEFTAMGFTVHLAGIGYFSTTIRSKGAPTEKEVTAANATDIVPHFVFGKDYRDKVKKTKLEKWVP